MNGDFNEKYNLILIFIYFNTQLCKQILPRLIKLPWPIYCFENRFHEKIGLFENIDTVKAFLS